MKRATFAFRTSDTNVLLENGIEGNSNSMVSVQNDWISTFTRYFFTTVELCTKKTKKKNTTNNSTIVQQHVHYEVCDLLPILMLIVKI